MSHLSSNEIGAHLDGALGPAERDAIEHHLADCGSCRRQLVESRELIDSVPGSRRWVLPLAAAAAIAVMLPILVNGGSDAVHRRQPLAGESRPVLIEPDGAIAGPVRFLWHAYAGAQDYRLTLLDESGSVIWQFLTRDTSALLPDTVRQTSGQSYFWTLEARYDFDRWSEPAAQEFLIQVRRP